jgi:hypothetical protein
MGLSRKNLTRHTEQEEEFMQCGVTRDETSVNHARAETKNALETLKYIDQVP